jgi:hypothetical protein
VHGACDRLPRSESKNSKLRVRLQRRKHSRSIEGGAKRRADLVCFATGKQEVPGTTSKITVDVELLRLPDADGDGELVPYVQLSIDLLADMLEQPDRWIIEWQHYLDYLQDNLKLVRLLLGWKAKIHVRFAVRAGAVLFGFDPPSAGFHHRRAFGHPTNG